MKVRTALEYSLLSYYLEKYNKISFIYICACTDSFQTQLFLKRNIIVHLYK